MGPGRGEQDMNDEMRQHLERSVDRLMARGMSREEALIQARREFGNATVIEEDARDARGMRWLESFASDVRFALRYFARNKITAGIVVAVLALGIGANTVIFSVMQAMFFRPPLAVPENPEHVLIHAMERKERQSWQRTEQSMYELRALAARRETFRDVVAWTQDEVVIDAGDSTGARGADVQFVTPNYFAFLGVPLASGPGFARADSAVRAAIMSFRFATLLYGAPSSALGKQILVNNVPLRVVGIAPPTFQGALRDMQSPALWIPLGARSDVAQQPPSWIDTRVITVAARLAAGVDRKSAEPIAARIATTALSDAAKQAGRTRTAWVRPMHDPSPDDTSETMMEMAAVMLVGLLILLVACTNVSSLMVAAAVARRHEIAVRLSLGASRLRVLRQLLSEAVTLTLIGGLAGLFVAWLVLSWVGSIQTDGVDVMPDAGTIVFMLIVAVGTGLVFGTSPALHAMGGKLGNALRDSGGGATSKSRLQRFFVVTQIVLSQPLLVLLGVMLSLAVAEYSPLPESLSQRLVSVRFRPMTYTGGPAQRREAVDSLIPRIAAHPEVVGAVHEATSLTIRRFKAADRVAAGDSVATGLHVEGAEPGYLRLLDVPIVLGRDLSLADTAGRDFQVVIGSDAAREIWGEANPIGRALVAPPAEREDSLTLVVVGVYDAAHGRTGGGEAKRVYTATGKHWRRDAILLRTRGAAEPFIPQLRELMRAGAPGVPVTRVITRARADAQERRTSLQVAMIAGVGAAVALLLASLGLYGVIALAVQQRKREIGIRIAVGARPNQVVRMFTASGLRLGLLAMAIGLPVTIVAVKLGLDENEIIALWISPWMIGAGIAAILLAVAWGAAWIPARRAARVDPATTLRVE